jgi:hypothetical protein
MEPISLVVIWRYVEEGRSKDESVWGREVTHILQVHRKTQTKLRNPEANVKWFQGSGTVCVNNCLFVSCVFSNNS